MNSAWILYGFFSVLKPIEKYGEKIHAPFMHLFMHLFTHLFIHLFMHLFTHLFKRKVVFLFIHRVCEACQIEWLPKHDVGMRHFPNSGTHYGSSRLF